MAATAKQTFRIVFKFPNDTGKYYFWRDAVEIIHGQRITKHEVTANVQEAHKFQRESAVAFRDRFRQELPATKGYEIYIEDAQGNGPLFEPRAIDPTSTEDNRKDKFFEPDGFENTHVGYTVKPANLPGGPCYCVRACDIPSMAGMNAETIYGATPMEAIERALATWGSLMQPSPHPNKQQWDDAAAARTVHEIQRSTNPGRTRPGDLRRQ